MAAAALSAFYDHLLPELPGCTTAMVDLHLLHAARDLCERTSCWRVDFTTSGQAAEAVYDISAPEPKSEVVRLTRMVIDDVILWDDAWHPASHADEPKYRRDRPPFAMNIDNTEFTLATDEIPSADGSENIELTAALKPSFTATTLPGLLKTELLEALRTGTLSRLMQMGGKPWTDRGQAGEYRADFNRHCSIAASNAQNGYTKQRLRVRKAGI